MKKFAVAFLANWFLFAATPVWAGFNDGVAAFETSDYYATALKEF